MCNVSVITIFKRRHKKVKECLNSLINQTLPNTEIICIYKEENSDIDSFVKETQEKYNNIKIIYKTKAQDVTAKNKALEEAQGKYIIVMNGDMCLEKTTLEKLYNVQERNDTDIAICGFNIIDINTNQLIHEGLNNKFKEVEEINGKNENFAYLNLDGGNKLIKKEIARNIKFQNYDECQDEIFILSCYSKANKISFINEQLYYKYEDNSNKNLKNQVQIKDLKDGLVEVKKLYKDAGKYEKLKNMLTFIAFTRIGMRALIELTVTKNGDLKDNIRYVMNYLDINFFEWRKNPFLKLKNVPRKKYWIAYTMYKYGFQQLFIKIYSKPIEKGNKLLII